MKIALGLLWIWFGLWTALDMLCGAGRDGSWWWRSGSRIVLGFAVWAAPVYIFAGS